MKQKPNQNKFKNKQTHITQHNRTDTQTKLNNTKETNPEKKKIEKKNKNPKKYKGNWPICIILIFCRNCLGNGLGILYNKWEQPLLYTVKRTAYLQKQICTDRFLKGAEFINYQFCCYWDRGLFFLGGGDNLLKKYDEPKN